MLFKHYSQWLPFTFVHLVKVCEGCLSATIECNVNEQQNVANILYSLMITSTYVYMRSLYTPNVQ